jgi:hypothetical protein
MRFIALALGTLAFAGFTVGNDLVKPSPSPSSGVRSMTKTANLSLWHPTVTMPASSTPTAAIGRGDEPLLTHPDTAACRGGSTKKLQHAQTNVCTTTVWPAYPETRGPCATSLYAYWICTTTATKTQSNDLGGRARRWVAQHVEATHKLTARSTQDLGGRSQRAVARFAEPTITAQPSPVLAGDISYTTLPICSFNLSAGRYDCPKITRIASPHSRSCSFNSKLSGYICLKLAEATSTAAVNQCPGGADMCIPANEIQGPKPTTMKTVRKA